MIRVSHSGAAAAAFEQETPALVVSIIGFVGVIGCLPFLSCPLARCFV
jgi:hypothetical protein